MIRIPLSTAIPVFMLHYTALTASDVKFGEDEILYEFDPMAMKVLKEHVYDSLPAIDSRFQGTPPEGTVI